MTVWILPIPRLADPSFDATVKGNDPTVDAVRTVVEFLGLFGGITAILILATWLERGLGVQDRPPVSQPFERPLVRVVGRVGGKGRVPRDGMGAGQTRGHPERRRSPDTEGFKAAS
jgi:hypothetical protein